MKSHILETILLSVFFLLLILGGYYSYTSIDFDVLKRLESTTLALPTPAAQNTPAPVSQN